MRSGETAAERSHPSRGTFPQATPETRSRVLKPKEEREIAQQLAQHRQRLKQTLQPLLHDAPAGTRLTHFDQQLTYVSSLHDIKPSLFSRLKKELRPYQQAKHCLVLANVAWVHKLARQQCSRNVTEEDLFQEGICGLLKAIDRFEVSRGLRLMTYATWYIREAMQQVRARQAHTVALSAHDQTLLGEIENSRVEFQHRNSRQPSEAELGERVDRPSTFLRKIQGATSPSLSLETNSTSRTIPVVTSDPVDAYDHQDAVQSTVTQMLDLLPERERLVVTHRFGLEGKSPTSLEALGGRLKVSKERIRQIQRQAIRRMQEFADERSLDFALVF